MSPLFDGYPESSSPHIDMQHTLCMAEVRRLATAAADIHAPSLQCSKLDEMGICQRHVACPYILLSHSGQLRPQCHCKAELWLLGNALPI